MRNKSTGNQELIMLHSCENAKIMMKLILTDLKRKKYVSNLYLNYTTNFDIRSTKFA